MDLRAIKVDPKKIEEGAWVDDIPMDGMEGLRLNVCGMSSLKARELSMRLFRQAPKQDRKGGVLTPEANDRITTEVLIEVVLKGWDGVNDGENAIPYSKEMARTILTDPAFGAFRRAVIWAADQVESIDQDDLEDEAKN